MLLRQIIVSLAVAFPLVVSSVRLPVERALGRARVRQARPPAAAAVAAGAVAAEVAEPERPVSFRVGRVLHPRLLHQPRAGPADEIRTADRREAAPVQLPPEVPACRTVYVHRDPVAESALLHPPAD